MKHILLVSPHTDDCEFGFGATIARLVEAQVRFTWVVCSNAAKSLPEGLPFETLLNEQRESVKRLGIPQESLVFWDFEVRTFPAARQEILEKLVALRKQNDFDAIFCPSLNDWHQDHQTIATEVLRAFKATTILGYDLPWNNFSSEHSLLMPVSKENLDRKMHALDAFESQRGRPYMSRDIIESIARVRAIPIAAEFAEAFEVIRMVGRPADAGEEAAQ